VRRVHRDRHSHNEIVGYYLGAVCVFYGITLGLLAVAAWQTYSDVETRVGQEAAAIGALYRDFSSFPEPDRTELQSDLRQYTRQVIDVAWPEQRRGIIPQEDGVTLGALQTDLIRFEPMTESQKTIYAEAYRGFDMRSQSMHFWMTAFLSGLLGRLIYILAALDRPFRGAISVSPEPFQIMYTRRMQLGK
jgi:hypothetical protein